MVKSDWCSRKNRHPGVIDEVLVTAVDGFVLGSYQDLEIFLEILFLKELDENF